MARTKMSEAEKSARKAVRDYLKALEANKPRRGRKRTPESIAARLDVLSGEIDAASSLKRLELAQERLDLQAELERMSETVDISALEADFVEHAKSYGEAKGISYNAWREVGVEASVLKAASISRAD